MNNYIVSARKYRPTNFDTVVGQQGLTTTLKNAIRSNKLAHAYLFCGPRGVGKTTCARIFAKTINCLQPSSTGEACNTCESCQAFNEQRSYNIHELDAASNNSVDDIRSLIDQVRIPPQVGKYKVYIIDEVHMLSQAAFNAFLKTLEEPPHHAIFILATTEKHKILPTILSRCQIYDFSRISVADITSYLQKVAQEENIEAEPEALNVIAQKADGGMRDALSIFDQVVSFSGKTITYEKVIENLNVLDYDYYFNMTSLFLANKAKESLLIFNEIINKGFNGNHFISGLAAHFRDLLVSQDQSTIALLEMGNSVRKRYQQQAQKCKAKFLFKAIKLCNKCDLNYKISNNKRLLIEITLIELSQLTLEDSDEEGHCPTQTLKPVFNKVTKAIPQVTATVNVEQTTVKKIVTPSIPTVKKQSQASVALSSHRETNKSKTNPNKFSISIKKRAQEEGKEKTKNKEVSTKTVAVKQNKTVVQADLSFKWREYAAQLPIQESAISGRMQGMEVVLLENNHFIVKVENELVKQLMERQQKEIETYLQTELSNTDLTMQIHVTKPSEKNRAYTRREKLDLMIKHNPTIELLRKTFRLELN
jgi:DNA polymerase-3 subunit gamma/tau